MTLANKITLARIGLIPVFIVLAVLYGNTLEAGRPDSALRHAAVLVFLVAAASDGIDGYIARRYNQRSRLGTILDPLADKGLLLAGLLTLTFSDWEYPLPLWFAGLVIVRDLVIVLGSVALHFRNGEVHVHPSWLGKLATFFQMLSLASVMLRLPFLRPPLPVAAAGLFTALSGMGYVLDGIGQLRAGNRARAGVRPGLPANLPPVPRR